MAGNICQWTRGIYDPDQATFAIKGTSFRDFVNPAWWAGGLPRPSRKEWLGFRCVWVPPSRRQAPRRV